MNTPINILNMLAQAHTGEEADHAAGEVVKAGVLRAGNSGILLQDGRFAGSCPRVAHLRTLSLSAEDVGADRRIMFGGGKSNEDYWYYILGRTWGGPILREEEIPIEWFTENGTKVTGRPDIVLCSGGPGVVSSSERTKGLADGTIGPQLGLELKMVSAFNTARTVLFKGGGQPKLAHLCQAAHYSWRLGIPFRLVYTSYVDYPIPAWGSRDLPNPGTPGSEYLQYNDRGQAKKIMPFVRVYELDWDGKEMLRYRKEGTEKWTATIVGKAAVEGFYEAVASMGPGVSLPPRPETLDSHGKPEGFTLCAYCELNPTCGETDYEKWVGKVRVKREGDKSREKGSKV